MICIWCYLHIFCVLGLLNLREYFARFRYNIIIMRLCFFLAVIYFNKLKDRKGKNRNVNKLITA